MSLIDDISQWYENGEVCPPGEDFNLIAEETLGEKRWGLLKQWVFERDGEYVAVEDVEPATEMQEWGDYGEPKFYPVEPYEVTVTKYRKV